MTPTWVIGSGGLIGRSIVAASGHPWYGGPVDWDDESVSAELQRQLRSFAEHCGDRPWSIAWAAGAGTVGATAETLERETTTLQQFVRHLVDDRPRGTGAFLLASSAGGVYAGSAHPPFTDTTEPKPISPYGEHKLRNETVVADVLKGTCPVVLARFSNVYGPDQNLAKAQGLISQLALAAVTRQPLNVYVPLETVRDYVFARDAGFAARYWLDEALHQSQHRGAREAQVRVIASGQGTTVAALIGTVSDIIRRRIPIALGTNANARAQVLDLRMTPSRPLAGRFPSTPLPVGMKQVVEAVLRHQQAGAHVR